MAKHKINKLYYRPKELAGILNLDARRILMAMKKGQIKYATINGHTKFIPKAEMERILGCKDIEKLLEGEE